jgi:Zn-dependent protease
MLPVLAPPLLLSLTMHEYAHARAALAFGDPTALRAGRVTLNPLKHLDPIGTIALFLIGFGWAKPVPVNPMNMRNRRMGEIVSSFAGPATNLGLAILAGLLTRVSIIAWGWPETGPLHVLQVALLMTLSINVILAVFNMIPLFPLDGHHILRELLPGEQRGGFMLWQMRYGSMVLMALLFGPRLLGAISGQYVPSPVGWLMDNVLGVAILLFVV